MNPPCDIAVIGGGLVGASLALALRRAALSVLLIEPKAPAPEPAAAAWDSRVYAISPGNAAFLEAIGAWGRLERSRVQRVESMTVCGDQPGGRLSFSAYDAGLRELAWIVEGGALQRALQAALAEQAGSVLPVHGPAADLQVAADSVSVTLDDGRVVAARLVVGTDGGDSWLRRAAGIGAQVHDYGQSGVVANFESERSHHDRAFQWFRGDGVLALLPLPGNRVSMVWSTDRAHAGRLLEMDGRALAEAVSAASGGVVGSLHSITAAAAFPLRRVRVARLAAPRTVLAGDAAHGVHPLAGQGVNLGFRDVRELAAVLAARAPLQDCGDGALLRRYERARREDIATMTLGTDGLQKLFAPERVWLSGIRNAGMAALDRLPLLKTMLIRHAAA